MSAFKWSKEVSIYLPEIDAEHRGLFRIGADLQKAVMSGSRPSQIKPILANLQETAEEHFRHEERLMRVVHYAAFQWHKGQHDTIRKRMKQAVRGLEAGDTGPCLDLVKFLHPWLDQHLTVTDRMMGAFIRNYLRFNTSLAS
jgi:hemerythrin